MIIGELKLQKHNFKVSVCTKTLYNYINDLKLFKGFMNGTRRKNRKGLVSRVYNRIVRSLRDGGGFCGLKEFSDEVCGKDGGFNELKFLRKIDPNGIWVKVSAADKAVKKVPKRWGILLTLFRALRLR
jgi:hypothetical protein